MKLSITLLHMDDAATTASSLRLEQKLQSWLPELAPFSTSAPLFFPSCLPCSKRGQSQVPQCWEYKTVSYLQLHLSQMNILMHSK